MKNLATLIAGVILGLIGGIILYPVFNDEAAPEHTAIQEEQTSKAEEEDNMMSLDLENKLVNKASDITPQRAYEFYDAYHGLSDPSTSKACFTTTIDGEEKKVTSLFLPYEGFLNVISKRVTDRGKTFLGLAGVPAYNPDIASHTVIWVPVVEDPNGRQAYYIPESGHEGLLIDYVELCPHHCRVNECVLGNVDWKHDANCVDPFQ
jgi:hypothetical protein